MHHLSLLLGSKNTTLPAMERLFSSSRTQHGVTFSVTISSIILHVNGGLPLLRWNVFSGFRGQYVLGTARRLSTSTNSATLRDGPEVKVFSMPQLELNKFDSFTTMLHAAHMHNDEIPRKVQFPQFVAIAETCLGYQCTSPLEIPVEYLWLPQWKHKADEEYPEGLINYIRIRLVTTFLPRSQRLLS